MGCLPCHRSKPPGGGPRGGRPRAASGPREPRWGCLRVVGECRKLGVPVSATSVRTILRRHHLGPAPRRSGPTWTQFLRTQAAGALACDFLDPAHLVFALIALAAWWQTVPQLAEMITGADGDDPAERSRRRAFVVEAARRLAAAR